MSDHWIPITTQAVTGRGKIRVVKRILAACQEIRLDGTAPSDADELEDVRQDLQAAIASVSDTVERQWLTALLPVLFDLHQQGWQLKYDRNQILGCRTETGGSRDTLRARLVARRDQQLVEPSVRKFIQTMESWQLFRGNRTSVFSLLADGREVTARLANDPDSIKPYIQFVNPIARCVVTGLRLQDIWRYFRHTWTNPYESIPGRSLQLIVRDGGHPNHPVMGIAALSSAAVSLGARDRFIGWDTSEVVANLLNESPVSALEWANGILETAMSEIYCVDFVREKVLPADKARWNVTHINELQAIAEQARASHHRLMDGTDYKSGEDGQYGGIEWEAQAEMPLFRAKRATELASIIELRDSVEASRKLQAEVTIKPKISDAAILTRVVKLARSKTVGTEIADLTICGALAPYSHLAAGKLVAMLAVSPAAVAEYKNRYAKVAGVISSSMAGRPIVRAANLCYVGTTSLYGKRPNQYDRLNMPAATVGGSETASIKFQHIQDSGGKRTKGVGTFHFSPQTIKALEHFAVVQKGGWRVNNVFGEGTSPKLRGLRSGLELLGLNSNELLVHGIEKSVYGAMLASNVDRYLLGLDPTPVWLFDPIAADTCCSTIGHWWLHRWALARLSNEEVRMRMQRETMVYPIRHSARVQMPVVDAGQSEMFN
jgi:hypothetical protein